MMQRLDDPYHSITEASASGHLEQGLHSIYWEEAGCPSGLPIIMIHGGPGGASSPAYRRLCDPKRFRIIQFDQRGCGRSKPAGALEENTLDHIIADMEVLRQTLGIKRWIVAGGSWGSTVALRYAQVHTEHCLGLYLISTWLCRDEDIQWWFNGVKTAFPELWDSFSGHIPAAERHDLRTAYCKRILGQDRQSADTFATALYLYEEGIMHFAAPIMPPNAARGPAYGRIFAHYAAHKFFVADQPLLGQCWALNTIPTTLVTGRYDMCTPPSNAYALSKVIPHARLRIVPGAGHYPTEERMSRACVAELSMLAERIEAAGPTI